ncbi:MAG: hypothetical protein K2X27_03160 [Candidatus Obscuribacterales bacterium]|nr:hypothetical protein [Candidatus Obscuribacterales bacterium]
MARSDQYVGLNPWAKRLVNRKVKVREQGVRFFADGSKQSFKRWARLPDARKEHAGVIRGAYTPVVAALHRYTMADGRQFFEYLQAAPWYGGPVYYVALKDKNGKPVPESLWTDEEIGC